MVLIGHHTSYSKQYSYLLQISAIPDNIYPNIYNAVR